MTVVAHVRAALAAIACIALVSAPDDAGASVIVASADSNITAALTGSETAVNPGNRQFFTNLLDGGTRVLIAGDSGSQFTTLANYANTYYNSIAGVTSTFNSATITTASLSGVDLFLSIGRARTYSASEISALMAFLNAGGDVLVAGDGTGFETIDAVANGLLFGLGSTLPIVPAALDSGYTVASPSRIGPAPLTTGVSSFTYAYTGVVTGGTSLVRTTNGTTFLASEVVGAQAVPEPTSLALVAVALAGVGLASRRRRL